VSIFHQKSVFCYGQAILFLLSGIAGCNNDQERLPIETSKSLDPLVVAKEAFELGNADEAAEILLPLLIQRPNDPELTLLTAQVEAARGNSDSALELANSIDVKGRLGIEASQLRYRHSILARNEWEAERALADLASLVPNDATWKHDQWHLLNLQGRRQDASELAEQLCREGLATEQELLSLIRRTDSFPLRLPESKTPESYFLTSLGIARWYFSHDDYQAGLAALEKSSSELDRFPEALALYGRLLAETQSVVKTPAWHARCNDQVKKYGDYWAGLGAIFVDRGDNEGAARALLEAIYRNPTDRVCYQRLGRVLDALGKKEDAEQFRLHGIDIADSERAADQLSDRPNSVALKKNMAKEVLELFRPFEMLQWTAKTLPSTAIRERTLIDQQRSQLLRNPKALTIASETSLFGLDRTQFAIDVALAGIAGDQGVASEKLNLSCVAESLATPRLVNVAESVGLDFQWYPEEPIDLSSIPIYQSVGGGIAVLDYDLDGWPDVYLAQGSGKPPTILGTKSNTLFRNLAGKFRDETIASATDDFNYSSGQAVGDINQDGFPDLFIGNLGPNRLLVNNGDGTFSDCSDRMASHDDTFTTSVAIADISGDALPDIYECNYIEMNGAFALPEKDPDGREQQPSPLRHYAQSDRWFRNQGNGSFGVDLIDEKIAKPGTSLGIIVTDFNADGRNEVFVGNDVRPNHYLFQDKESGFRNAADALGCANGFRGAANGCMGIATGDFDRDGLLDLQIANFFDESANLYLQTKSGAFVDAAVRYGLDKLTLPNVGFGTKAIDFDRNGWLDFVVTNGHIFDMSHAGEPFKMRPQFFSTIGDRYVEVNVEDPSGYWEGAYLGRAMTTLDFDRNGTVDLLIGHLDAKLALLSNQTDSPGQFLQFELVGTESERDAIGAKIVVEAGGQSFSQWVAAGDGYFSSDEPMIEIGLGRVDTVQAVHVYWPSGKHQTLNGVDKNKRYLVTENENVLFAR